MQHVSTSVALGAAGLLVGAVAGVGATSLLAGAAEPVAEKVFVTPDPVPEQPDRLVQWLKEHPRSPG